MNVERIVIVTIIIFFLSACDRAPSEHIERVPFVRIFDVRNSVQLGVRTFPARIIASDRTPLAFKRSGQLQQLLVSEGEQVEQGQLIAELNSNDARLRLSDRDARFKLAQTQFNRYATLNANKVISRAELDIQRAARDSALAELKLAQEALRDMQIRAPFSGIIAEVTVHNYQVVQMGQSIAVLNSLDSLDVLFSIPENLFRIIDSNNIHYQPMVQLNNLPNRYFSARYKEHTTDTTTNSLTYQMTLTMERPQGFPLLSGMSGSVKINLGNLANVTQASNIVVPAEAVFDRGNTPYNQSHVWVVKDKGGILFVEPRRVKIGQLTANGIQIVSGLADGERIVAAHTRELRPNQEVRAWVRERGL